MLSRYGLQGRPRVPLSVDGAVLSNPRSRILVLESGRTSPVPLCIEDLMRVLLLNLGVGALGAAAKSLAGHGRDFSAEYDLTVDPLLALWPQLPKRIYTSRSSE